MAKKGAAQIDAILKLYAENITEDMKRIADEVAEEGVVRLKKDSPKRTGKYSRGWKKKTAYKSANEVRYTLHNSTKGWLTSFLEKGHAKRGGGRVAAIPHIKPVEDDIIKEYEKRVTEAIKNESK